MSRSQSIPAPALHREPSASQLGEIRRLSSDVLGRPWPENLHPIGTRGDADKVIRTLLSAHGLTTPGYDPDLLEEINQLKPQRVGFLRYGTSVPARSPAEALAAIEKKGTRMNKLPALQPGDTWLSWAASVTGQAGKADKCPTCGGTGEVATLPSQASLLCLITGLDSPTVTPARALNRLTNPSLDMLRRVAKLLNSDLNIAAEFIETLVKAFDSHPTRRRKGRKKA